MTESNLQKSEFIISKILEVLINLGLQQGSSLSFADLSLPKEDGPIFNGCCTWLLEEGIIRCSNAAQAMGGDVTLFSPMITAKGFSLLNQSFILGDNRMQVGKAVREVAGGNTNFAGLGDFFGGLLGGFTKSMGS
jgi:hypothetical protein